MRLMFPMKNGEYYQTHYSAFMIYFKKNSLLLIKSTGMSLTYTKAATQCVYNCKVSFK